MKAPPAVCPRPAADSSCIFRRSEQRETPAGRLTPTYRSVDRLIGRRGVGPRPRGVLSVDARRRATDDHRLSVTGVEGSEGRRRAPGQLCHAAAVTDPMTDSRVVERLGRRLMSAALICVLMSSSLAGAEYDGTYARRYSPCRDSVKAKFHYAI